MLAFCGGTRAPKEIHAAFCHHLGVTVDYKVVTDTLAQLDAACLLENERSQQAKQAHLREYRSQPHRWPALADLSYPGDAKELTALFDSYAEGDQLHQWQPWRGRGVISPHIDYQRGGPVYSKVWRRAQAAVLEADLVLIFGTDHNGSSGTITLTRQPYATPFGVIPTDLELVDEVAQAIGPNAIYAEELHHRTEHSVELSAVWLHYICHQANAAPPPMLPVLCGSFHHFTMNGSHPARDGRLTTAVETLRRETASRNVLAVASVDLSHVGPGFGDAFPMDQRRRSALTRADRRLIQTILRGDAAGFYDQISAVQDHNRVCGFSSIYLMLRYLGQTEGIEVAYQHCPADAQNTSLVSICGLLLE
jgi:AmmeMemoRadiSam system protein B